MPLHLVDHPLVHDALADLRERTTPIDVFRRAAARASTLVAAEALRRLPVETTTVQTPLEPTPGHRVTTDIVVVPILRAGLGMLEPVLALVPKARVGYIGLQRDEATAVASQYYAKLPAGLETSVVLVVDPMLATAGSSIAAIHQLRRAGARDIRLVCIVAAPEGVAELARQHPDVHVFTPVVDRELNAQKYILPGLGDFGDRLYGTT